jgi:hypothetical protein
MELFCQLTCPEQMTVILQHQFWDLVVGDTHFEVGLSFGGVPEKLIVPYEALSSDPAVWQAVAQRIGVTPRAAAELRPVTEKPAGSHDAALRAEAEALHARLAARGFAALGLAS